MCVYTVFLYSNLSAFPHILSLDECCIGVYQPLNLTPALYCGTQRQLMLKVCSRARDHLLQAIEAWSLCQLSEGGSAGGVAPATRIMQCMLGRGCSEWILDKIWCVSSPLAPLSSERYISGMLIPFSSDPFLCFQLLIKTDHCSLIIVCFKTNNGKGCGGVEGQIITVMHCLWPGIEKLKSFLAIVLWQTASFYFQ